MMLWLLSDRADPSARHLADRHYNRQKVGSKQFAPPGRCLVLRTEDSRAFWITSYPFAEFVKHRWAGAWVCSAFRNEGGGLSSLLIRDALAASVATWEPPQIETWIIDRRTPRVTWVYRGLVSMVTFVDTAKTRRKRDPGRCYRRAGFEEIGATKAGLVALGIRWSRLPDACPPMRTQEGLFA